MNIATRMRKLPKESLTISILCEVHPDFYVSALIWRGYRQWPFALELGAEGCIPGRTGLQSP
jgi:hypothetical protein